MWQKKLSNLGFKDTQMFYQQLRIDEFYTWINSLEIYFNYNLYFNLWYTRRNFTMVLFIPSVKF